MASGKRFHGREPSAVAALLWAALVGLLAAAEPGRTVLRGDLLVVGGEPARAERIAAWAAETRRGIHVLLFGNSEPPPWVPPCAIHLHRDRVSFAREVAGAPPAVRGATSIEFGGGTVRSRRIDVMDAVDGDVPDSLAHELVHVVLADRFVDRPPPRWADEGLATLFDSAEKQRGHHSDFQAAAARGQAWRVAELMALESEPAEPARLRVFYGQSAALTRWLVDRGGGPAFLQFLDAATDDGVEPALQVHYGIDSLTDLERAYREPHPGPPEAAVRRAERPPGPAAPSPGETP